MISGQRSPGFWFTFPAIVLLTVFIVYPLLSTVQMSVTDAGGSFVGLANYTEIVESPRTARATSTRSSMSASRSSSSCCSEPPPASC